MNIIVNPYRGRLCFRPDTTWDREVKDFYVPESVGSLWYAPVVFIRISKAGKCIGPKFASRYYDGANFGMLMYDGGVLAEKAPDSLAFASMLDHSSILPFPLYQPQTAFNPANLFEIKLDETTIFTYGGDDSVDLQQTVENTLCAASSVISLRIGDLLAIELAAPAALSDSQAQIKGCFANHETFNFKTIF